MYLPLVLATILYFIVNVKAIPVIPCEGVPPPVSVFGTGCKELPCILLRGQTVEFYITFNSTSEIKSGTWEIQVTVLGTTIEIPMPDDDLCHNMLVGRCPLKTGQIVTFSSKFEILAVYPKINFIGQITLKDQNKNPFICFTFPAEFK